MKTSRTHFKYFTQQVDKWVSLFNINSKWKVYTTHRDLMNESLAETECDHPAKVATIFLNKDWSENKVTEKELDETAFHEVLEIIFDKMDSMSRLSCLRDVVDEARHEAIQTFTSVIFDPLYREKSEE